MRALISVYDKTGIEEFAGSLSEMGWELFSTGGTEKNLKQAGLKVTNISELTGYPDMLGGRVKTLHPAVFASILARKDQKQELEEFKLKPLGLVCVNLYPFETALGEGKSGSELLEYIDIGGVCLLRAAAKNYSQVVVVSSPGDYKTVTDRLKKGSVDKETRKKLASKAFAATCAYDAAISGYFSGGNIFLSLPLEKKMRYGENPHQDAELYGSSPYKMIQGEKELSFNNYQDLDAAAKIVKEFEEPAVAVIKHTVPCGAAIGNDIKDAYSKAYGSDPMSAFGGIAAFNREVDGDTAKLMLDNYYEVAVAPSFTAEALKTLAEKPNLRVVLSSETEGGRDWRRISGGFLLQDNDNFNGEEWNTVTSGQPSQQQMSDLKFAWKIARFMKSNAVVIASGGRTVGLGGGETARVTAVDIAVEKMKHFFPELKEGAVMASDAFFPFPDAVETASSAGIKSIVQPGGSKNDDKVIEAAQKLNVSMVFTGRRHFLH